MEEDKRSDKVGSPPEIKKGKKGEKEKRGAGRQKRKNPRSLTMMSEGIGNDSWRNASFPSRSRKLLGTNKIISRLPQYLDTNTGNVLCPPGPLIHVLRRAAVVAVQHTPAPGWGVLLAFQSAFFFLNPDSTNGLSHTHPYCYWTQAGYILSCRRTKMTQEQNWKESL